MDDRTGSGALAPTDTEPAPKRKRLGRDERRRQLVDAAVRLIGTSGIRGTTMSRISAELGLSEMAAYRHFASKDELLMEANTYVIGRILEWLDSSTNPSVHRLRELGESHFDTLVRRPGPFHGPLYAVPHHESGRRPAAPARDRQQPRMKDTIEAHRARGDHPGHHPPRCGRVPVHPRVRRAGSSPRTSTASPTCGTGRSPGRRTCACWISSCATSRSEPARARARRRPRAYSLAKTMSPD